MSTYLSHLESCVGPSRSAWRTFFRDLLDTPELLLSAVMRSVRQGDHETLIQAANLASQKTMGERLRRGFSEGGFDEDSVDVEYLHDSVKVAFALAAVASFADRNASQMDLDRWAKQQARDAWSVEETSIDEPLSYFLGMAQSAFHGRGSGPATLLHWLRYWLRIEPVGQEFRVPVACVVEGKGALAHLFLTKLAIDEFPSELIVDLPAAIIPYKNDFLSTITLAAPAMLNESFSWRVQPPRTSRFAPLSGNSIDGAITIALRHLNAGKPWYPDILIVGRFNPSGAFSSVGGEEKKLEAACESFERMFHSADPARAAKCVQKVIIPYVSGLNVQPYIDRGISVERCGSLLEVEAVIVRRESSHTDSCEIALSLRELKAVIDESAIDPMGMRMDFTHSLKFSSSHRRNGIRKIHYRTETPHGHLLAEAVPKSENIWQNDEALAGHSDLVGQFEEYELQHRYFAFVFQPRPGRTYALKAQVSRGFIVGNRNLHMHLWPDARHEVVAFQLDLRAYLYTGANEEVLFPSQNPQLRFWRWRDPETLAHGEKTNEVCFRCKDFKALPETRSNDLVAFKHHEPGLWRWELAEVNHGGAIFVEWEDVLIPNGALSN